MPLHGDRIGKQRFVILFAALEYVVDEGIIGDIEPLVLKGGEAGVEPALLIAERRDRLGAAPEFFHIGVGEQGLVAALSGALGQPRHLLREVVVGHHPLLEQAHRQAGVHLELRQHRHAAGGGGVDGLLPLLHAGGQGECGSRGADPPLPVEPERLILQHDHQIPARRYALGRIAQLRGQLVDLQGVAKHAAALQHLVHQIEQIEAGAGADDVPVVVDRAIHVANVGSQQLVAGLGGKDAQGKEGDGGRGCAQHPA